MNIKLNNTEIPLTEDNIALMKDAIVKFEEERDILPTDIHQVRNILSKRIINANIYHINTEANIFVLTRTKIGKGEFPSIIRLRQIEALILLMQCADALNGEDGYQAEGYYFMVAHVSNLIMIQHVVTRFAGRIIFKKQTDAQRTLQILGEDTIKCALGYINK